MYFSRQINFLLFDVSLGQLAQTRRVDLTSCLWLAQPNMIDRTFEINDKACVIRDVVCGCRMYA